MVCLGSRARPTKGGGQKSRLREKKMAVGVLFCTDCSSISWAGGLGVLQSQWIFV